VTFAELEKALNRVGCTMYDDSMIVFDHGNYASDAIDDSYVYTVTWREIAWLGLTCNGRKLVAVFRNLVTVEKYASPYMIVFYELLNVVENSKLYNIVKNNVVGMAVSERILRKLAESA
jgi:hypothetical protein